jgi:hypothetical protein
MYVQKAHGVKDLIKNLNDSTKTKAFFKQFVAGRHDMSNVTTASLFPYFSLLRLVDPLSSIRLGFNPKYTSSVTDLAANIMFRRVVPIALGITALSYLNFESDNITGTSLKGAAANSIANIDLGMRRVVDAFGIGERLKDNYENNVMSQYWFHDKYQTYDERKRWYQNGYSPVRKSRWWSFGSASEFRGGKIDYFQPNYLIQAHSNWQDIAIYGSSNEKWKHSWIPTPRHPLSPLRALLDPYWLERKHYWDRPYPVTGKMFEDNTPWGAILNPTVGAILKPQRKMHQRELQGTNIDVRSLIAARNASIRNKANENNNLVSLDMNGVFAPVSYYDPAYEGKQVSGGMAIAGGSNGSQYLSDYDAVGLKDYAKMYDSIESAFNSSNKGGSSDPAGMSIIDKIQISADRGNPVSAVAAGILPLDLIKGLNDSIKSRAKASGGGRGAGVLIPDAIFKESTGFGNGFDDADLRNTSTTKEMLQDAGYSSKELLGMYGFLFEQIMPGGRSSRLQSADRMSSFSRRFWDSSVGGIGGEFMEIARRFIPHENHDINRINNIQNTMPDWIPERYRFGDPYEKLPNGEMRLPGDGYEAMYKLHPDQFGNYGAFDRMKILADIAPWSKEYRIWREVAQKSVSDKYLRNEMKNIKRRVKQQSKTHTFYPYTFIGNKLEEETITVNKVTNAGVTGIGSGTTYNLAGINMTNGKLTDFIKPGQELRVKYDKDSITNGAVSAILYSNGENLNRMLLKKNVAEESDEDTLVANRAKLTDAQMDKGRFFELLGHAPIPLLHNKFMRVNSPLESWKQEQLYGTTYATWTHPIQGFIIPAFQSSFSIGYAHAALSVGTWALSEIADRKAETAAVKNVARAAFLLSNPAAFAGATTGYVLKLRNDFSNPKLSYMKTGSRIGAAIGIAGFGFTHASNPFAAITAGAALGEMTAANYFKSSKKTGALIGAAAGLAISAMKNPGFDMNKTFGPWIPKRVQKRWEIEEYYDRLRYIKYMGLYEKAARLAKRKEDINIKALITKTERDAQKREKIKKDLLDSKQKISNTYIDSDIRKQKYLNDIDEKLAALQAPQVTLKAGKYTKAALAYKQAADSTIYGLKENATMSQILRAVPKYQRDYILEFGKETNAKKRKEILKNVSPYVRKVLHVMWGDKQGDVEDNKSFFSTHNLPGTFWGGWQPDVDLDNVEIKTIKNEGMLLSDFGFYDSQSETPEAITAPGIDYNQETSALNIKKNLFTALNGAGLIGVDVSIEPSEQPGIQMVANIARISNYKVKEKINNVVGRIFY